MSSMQRHCGQVTEICLNPGFLPELWKNFLFPRNRMRIFPHGPMTWKVMQRSAWKDIAKWRIKRLNNCTKSQRHAWTTINSKKKKMDLLENCLKFGPRLFWHVFSWLVLVDLIFLWSVNKLARAVTKWTKACDRRLALLISLTHHTSECWQYCYVGNTAQQYADLDCFKILTLRETVKTQKSTSGGLLCIFESQTFCANKLDVRQETDISLTQLHRRWNYFSWCRFIPRLIFWV